jgi:chromosome segregation ATPase
MSDEQPPGLRARLTRSGEDALGKLAQDLLENPLVSGAITRAFEAREKAAQAQEVAFGALNLPSAADIERLTRRVRSVSQRLEGIEDGVDRLDRRLAGLASSGIEQTVKEAETSLGTRLGVLEEQLAALVKEISALREALPDAPRQVPSNQERLEVEQAAPAPRPRRRRASSSSS